MKITVIVHPNSKNPRIEKDLLEQIHVYVYAPPLEGKANKSVIDSLAEYYTLKKHQVSILSGRKSKIETFLIE